MTSSTPLQVPFTKIKSVTNNFSDASVIGEGFLGKIYGGQLSLSGELIDVAVRRLDHSFWLQDIAFDKEFKMLSILEHKNLVSNVGYCIENDEIIIINKREARGSLNRHLNGTTLNWKKRLEISVGVASVLSYLHNDAARGYSVIHRNVNSASILLDEKWEAKLSGFEYSMTIPAGDRDLVYEKLGIGTYKSDVFSFGIVLFEILCGTKAFISTENNKFQAQSAIFHFEGGKLHELVDPDLFKQMDPQSFHIFSETAYSCLKKQAPLNMIQVLTRLKRALKHQEKHENKEEHSTVVRKGPLSENLKLKLKHLEHMRIQLKDILSATENFASKCCIVSGGFGMVYSAVLEHVDREYCYAIEGKNEHEVPKRRNKVAVKRIFDTEDDSGEQGFYAEIEILTSCKHSNILTLLGFCDEGSAMILVYEYASNGSLADCLQNKSSMTNDSWAQRIKICLQVAKGLNYLHTSERDRQEIVHRDIKSANILLDENLDARIGDFGLCKFLTVNEDHKTEYSREIAGTKVYMDPQYAREGKLKKELDIYSFGVVMFEILTGKVAFHQIYTSHNNQGLAWTARWHFEKGTVKELVDPRIKEGITEPNFPFYRRRDQNSVDMFTKIAYQCLAVTQDNRPSMENVIKELEEALLFQKNGQKANLQVSLEDIRTAIQNFNDKNIIREDGHYRMYKGEVSHANGHTIIDVKRLDPSYENAFSAELKVLMEHKHENLIDFVGYCDELDEKIIIYEHGSHGTLDEYLYNVGLTWTKRLKICVDIASGLDFLHGGAARKEVVIHRNIKSANIQLDGDLKAKIVDFGFSVTRSLNQEMVFYTRLVMGTDCYMDPQYKKEGLISKECDIYPMGVVLFEIMSGKLAYSDEIDKYNVALGPLVRHWHEEEKLDEMVFKDTTEQIALKSLAAFQRIVIQCLHDKREERPTAGEVVMQLKKALEIQEKGMDIVRFSFEDIKLATENFSDEKCLGSGVSGKVYIGQLPHADGQKLIAAKQMDVAREFYEELEILAEFRHKNVIGLEGCCDEIGERVIVYEYPSKGSLDRWLNDISFSWVKRLSICIDIARGLNFLHEGVLKQQVMIHQDIRSSNILLSGDWKAKIALFGLSSVSPVNQQLELDHNSIGNLGYRDPQYASMDFLTKESDIYSLGVVLFEILCGRLTMEYSSDNNLGLAPLVRNHYDEGKLDEMIFEGIRKQMLPESLNTFAKVAYQCLHDNREERPTAYEVMIQLKQALESQEDWEKWEPKLPSDYKEIIAMSKTPEKYYTMKKKDLFHSFSRGIFIQEDKVLFWLDKNERRNKSISPTLFSYENKGSLKWRHRHISSFKGTSMMLDASNLHIRIQIKAQLLSPGVMYEVKLLFRFGDKRKIQDNRMYVNLKYKKGNETLHAYFARMKHDRACMRIELYQFLNDKEDSEFEILLESFSRYYCGSGAVYIDSIKIKPIKNVKLEEHENLKEVQQVLRSHSSMGQLQELSTNNEEIIGRSKNHDEGEKLFELNEVNGKIHYMLCAKEVLYVSSNRKLYNLKPSEESRFQEVIELLPQQVSGIKYKIEKQKLSPNTVYGCYLVFKLSEKCHGLHCPVKIRNILDKNGKLYEYCYFRSPAPWNYRSTRVVPKQREDGWMEVALHVINTNEDLKNDHFPVNLKLISFEGTMSGLIVEGLEFRPMEN